VARKRSPERDKAFEVWRNSGGKMPLKDIAEKLNVSPSQVRKWKSQDKWDQKFKGNVTKQKKSNVTNKNTFTKGNKKGEKVFEVESQELTEKQRLFCLYYVKCFNATQAALKAGYSKDSAYIIGHENLRKPKVAAEVRRLKGLLAEEVFIDANDVLRKYAEIAFSDITDYLTFGQREVQVMGAFGPVYEKTEDGETKKPVMKTVNYVDFNDSSQVDGTIISEVKQGRDGVSIKFLDKMKALEKLELYFDLLPDKWKRGVEEQKLKIAQQKLEIEKLKADELHGGEEGADDGFVDALKGTVKEVWSDEK